MANRIKHCLAAVTASLVLAPFAQGLEYKPTSTPVEQGWAAALTYNGTGVIVQDQGSPAWYADGSDGKAEWVIGPEGDFNEEASKRGWTLSFTMRMESGQYITNYYGNGTTRYLPVLKLSGDNLVADLEGDTTYQLASGEDAKAYHDYSISYDPSTDLATFTFNDQVITSNWSGKESASNIVAWGNGSSYTDSEAYYRSVSFEIPDYEYKPSFKLFSGGGEEGDGGSPYYRIPALQSGPGDYVFGFAEGRPNSADPGQPGLIGLTAKYSKDGGENWSYVEKISDVLDEAPVSDYSDARPIYNEKTGELVVVYTQWPDLCAQNGNCVKPDDDNRLIAQTFNFTSDSWNQPVDISENTRERAWDARGWDGRAAWSYTPSASENQEADKKGWSLVTEKKVVQGGEITDYYANGETGTRFLPTLGLNENNDLVVEFEGVDVGQCVLVEDVGSADFYTSELKYDPESKTASYYFNDQLITTGWEGVDSEQNHVIFGNDNSTEDGRASYRKVDFLVDDNPVASYDASVKPAADATPMAQGWTEEVTNNGAGILGWKSINAGPGNGIQLHWQTEKQGGNNGRLILPAIILDGFGKVSVTSVYSDDNGVSWDTGSLIQMPHAFNGSSLYIAGPSESDLVELIDGRILLTTRNDGSQSYDGVTYGPRLQFISDNGGITWTYLEDDELRLDINRVDASIIRYSGSPASPDNTLLLFSAPIGSTPGAANRYNLGIWSSKDEGVTWDGPVQVVSGESKYSDLTVMPDGQVGIMVEAVPSSISLLKMDVEELLPKQQP